MIRTIKMDEQTWKKIQNILDTVTKTDQKLNSLISRVEKVE